MERWRKFASNPYVIAAVAIALRLSYFAFLVYDRAPSKGQGVLHGFGTVQIATSIATGHGFDSPLAVASGPTAWLTPVFPCLLAVIFKMFGVGSLGAEVVIKFRDALFSSLVCLPLVALRRRLAAPWAGILSVETLDNTYHRFMINWTAGDNYLNDLTTELPVGLRIKYAAKQRL